MKKCPYCAEEIQDDAKVCKHCGRAPKKKTGCFAWIVAGFFLLFFVTVFRTCAGTRDTPSTSAPPAPPASTATAAPAGPLNGKYAGSSVGVTREGEQWIAMFDPALASDDATIVGVSRYVLELTGVNMRNVGAPRVTGKFLRFVAADGAHDVLIVKNEKDALTGLAIVKR